MLQVARLAPKALGESAALVTGFVRGKQHESGGFVDRQGQPDLYYTVFALESLLALRERPRIAPLREYLEGFKDGLGLDFVHRCCLCRAWASLRNLDTSIARPEWMEDFRRGLDRFRAGDGGFHVEPGAASGSAYAAFLALGAMQDAGVKLDGEQRDRLAQSVASLRTRDGGWSNDRGLPVGGANSTAAAVGVLRHLGAAFDTADAARWLLAQSHPMGGFRAIPNAPIPDLLSTATALHALSALSVPLDGVQELCLDFLDSLWSNEGGFHGHWHEEHLDCEYTYYGLLALGHLTS